MAGRFRRISRRLRRFLSQGSIEQRIAPETLPEERLRTYSTSKILETSDLDCVLKADLMINGRHRRLAWQETGNTEDRCNALTKEWLEEWQVHIRVKKISQCERMPLGGEGGTPLFWLYKCVAHPHPIFLGVPPPPPPPRENARQSWIIPFQSLDFGFSVSGTWIPDCNC